MAETIPTLDELEKLRPWATIRQIEYIDAYVAHGGNATRAAASLGISRKSIGGSLSGLKRRAERNGWNPEAGFDHKVPVGQVLKGLSTLDRVDPATGERTTVLQWTKTSRDHDEQLTALQEAFESVAEQWGGLVSPVKAPKDCAEDLLCVLPMGDPHLNMFAHHRETDSDDFDLGIARDNLWIAVDELVAMAPAAKQAILLNLGDLFHADSAKPITPTAGNYLDVDTRYPKVAEVAVELCIRLTYRMLEKFESVKAIMLPGNHDLTLAVMLAVALKAAFRDNPRVEVPVPYNLYQYYEWGTNLIGMHHGHGAKFTDLPEIMACDRPQAWGRTTWRQWYCGHVHHDSVRQKDLRGCAVETFRTLAPRDKWHHDQGYRSYRDLKIDVLHRTKGPRGRHIVNLHDIAERRDK